MSEQANKSRFAIDLDDLEKQLKAPAPAPARGGDALAELARIVGRDDPLKGLFAQRQGQHEPAAAVQTRIEPTFNPAAAANGPDNLKGALDEFDALLRRDLSSRGERAEPLPEPSYAPEMTAAPEPQLYSGQRPVIDMPAGMQQTARYESHDYDLQVPEPLAAQRPVLEDVPGIAPDPFISELEQHGRAGFDQPVSRPLLDERRAPHDLDEPRETGRHQRPAADDQLSRDLDEQLGTYPMPPAEPLEDMRSLVPRKSRKGLITIVALLGVAAVGVVGATTFRSGPKAPSGEPPVIKAETGPTKVAPQSPGGTEVPNQNKQIYERGTETKPADTKVVTREEQPLDVNQAARTAARVILPATATPAAPAEASAPATPATAAATPAATTSAAPGLGEPRRVRTVSIKPDGTAATAPAPAGGIAVLPPQRNPAVPTMVLPQAAAPLPKPVAAAPKPVPAPKPAARPVQEEETATEATAPLKISPPAARNKTQERVATAAATAPVTTTASTPASASEATGATGGFAVQLGAPGSEAEARSSFASLQRKFPDQLGGQSPQIRRADVNGRQVYRLRVGSLSREGATSLCTRLKDAGGQCFVAGN